MRARIIRDLEKGIYNALAYRIRSFLSNNLYAGTDLIAKWLLDPLQLKFKGIKRFKAFDECLTPEIKIALAAGDTYYFNLFHTSEFINEHTSEHELVTPYSDAITAIYNALFNNDRNHSDNLVIYTELKDHIEGIIGKQLAYITTLQSYADWVAIDSTLETDYDIKEAWLHNLSLAKLHAEKGNFLGSKNRLAFSNIAYLGFSYRDRKKTAKYYTTGLKKLSKERAFNFIDAAVKDASYMEFMMEISLQQRLAKRLGLPSFLSFIDNLKYPIAQYHAFNYIDELDDYVSIIREICERSRRSAKKEYLLIMALKSYFDFVSHSINDLESLSNFKSYNDAWPIEDVRSEASRAYNEWMDSRIKQSFEVILDIIFNKSSSASKYVLPFFDWLSSYRKLFLTHKVANSKRVFIDLLHDCFLERLKNASAIYHNLADQLLTTSVNHEGLQMLSAILSLNVGDTVFRDKLYNNYIKQLESEEFRWFSKGDVDTIESINHAYSFGLVFCSYTHGYEMWLKLFEKNRNIYEGWMHSRAGSLINYRESYLLTTGIGMAYHKYEQGYVDEANNIIFNVISLLFRQLRVARTSTVIDYETPLWFAGATLSKFESTANDRFIILVGEETDSLKLYMRVVYETLINAPVIEILPTTRTAICDRIRNEFFMIEASKVDVELQRTFGFYKEIKDEIVRMLEV